ncbi:MAG: hypothetical protein IH968_17520 [Gemmatimonadetes bacterium]|nr:hypothetical protein [Gemmatimonadota bacterium]
MARRDRCADPGVVLCLPVLLMVCGQSALAAQTPTATTTAEPASDSAAIGLLVDGFWADSAQAAHLPSVPTFPA